ncbi:flippase [Vibrio vulnificus]|uniref:flippase n=1 Tax=Vibrio vulnificus TaxID=672 RepID=UPI001CCFE086|nr:flippase [Vibrio vulnificus]MCA0772210.1 flippase [Vibrio vulnificus]
MLSKKLKIDTLWNLLGLLGPTLVGLFTIPNLINLLGNEQFGILSLIWILIGYFSIFDMGLGRAITHRISNLISSNEIEKISSSVLTGAIFLLGIGGLCGIVLALLSHNLAYELLNVTPENQEAVRNSLLVAALAIPITTLNNGFRGVLEAYLEFKQVNIVRLVYGVGNFVVPLLVCIAVGAEIEYVSISIVVLRLLLFLVNTYLVSIKITDKSKKVSKEEIKILLTFGSWMTVSNVVSPLTDYAEKFVLSAAVGASKIAFYTVPFDMLTRLLVIPSSLSTVLFPNFSKIWGEDKDLIKKIYNKALILVALVMVVIAVSIILTSKFAITIWISKDFAEQSWIAASILSLGLLFNGIARIPFALIQATGDTKLTAYIHIGELVLYFPFMYYMVQSYGINGAAVSWVSRVGLDMILMLYFANIKINSNQMI